MTSRWGLGLLLALSVGQGGCPPGTLEQPERFLDGGGSAACPPGFDVEKDLFPKTCGSSLCHDATEPEGDLDLVSADVASRVVGVPSADTNCSSWLLVDPNNPAQSFILEKLTKAAPACGDRMPDGPKALSAAQIDCVKLWIAGLVGSADSGAGGSAGAAGSGGATDSGGGG